MRLLLLLLVSALPPCAIDLRPARQPLQTAPRCLGGGESIGLGRLKLLPGTIAHLESTFPRQVEEGQQEGDPYLTLKRSDGLEVRRRLSSATEGRFAIDMPGGPATLQVEGHFGVGGRPALVGRWCFDAITFTVRPGS